MPLFIKKKQLEALRNIVLARQIHLSFFAYCHALLFITNIQYQNVKITNSFFCSNVPVFNQPFYGLYDCQNDNFSARWATTIFCNIKNFIGGINGLINNTTYAARHGERSEGA